MRRLTRGDWLGLAALGLWALVPVVLNLHHAHSVGGYWTGAEGPFAADQLQYMAWIRDEGNHLLASNLFDTAPSSHVFLHPMFLLSGLVWRAGLSLSLSLLVWKPVAVLVLFVAATAYARRLLPHGRARLAAVGLGLFYYVPLAPLLARADLISGHEQDRLLGPVGQLFVAGQEWGYLPAAIAVGLMAGCLLAAERRRVALAAAAGLGAAWLHPWEGEMLLLILGGLVVWGPGRVARLRQLALPLAATLAGVLYYYVLSRADPAWRVAASQNELPHFDLDTMLLALGPLAAAAAAGVRRPGRSIQEQALLLWPLASLAVYLVLAPSFPGHGLTGMSLPLAVLAVRAWRRRGLPAAAGWAAVAVLTVPGVAFTVDRYRDSVHAGTQAGTLVAGDHRALRWLAASPVPGGVLADAGLGAAVPAETGRRSWVGHSSTTPDWARRAVQAADLFAGRLDPAAARALVARARSRFVLAGCGTAPGLAAALVPVTAAVQRFGCATVYRLR